MPGPVVTISGPHGTGKSTYAKALAKALGLRYVCAGELFRELAKERGMSLHEFGVLAAKDPEIDRMIDERTKNEVRKGGVVIDAQLGAWMVKDLANVKVLVTADNGIRFERIAERDGVSVEDAARETSAREELQKARYKKYYGVNVDDLSIYDLKVDTSQHSVEETTTIVIDAVRSFMKKQRT